MLIFNAIQYKQLKFFYLIHLSYVLSFIWLRFGLDHNMPSSLISRLPNY